LAMVSASPHRSQGSSLLSLSIMSTLHWPLIYQLTIYFKKHYNNYLLLF